jgi:hypothetical protein
MLSIALCICGMASFICVCSGQAEEEEEEEGGGGGRRKENGERGEEEKENGGGGGGGGKRNNETEFARMHDRMPACLHIHIVYSYMLCIYACTCCMYVHAGKHAT